MNGGSSGRSAEEIRELLHKCSSNLIALEKYNNTLDMGRQMGKNNRKEAYTLILECSNGLKKVRALLSEYNGTDAPIYRRKLGTCSEKIEEVIAEIKEKEDRNLVDLRKSMAKASMIEESSDYQEKGT